MILLFIIKCKIAVICSVFDISCSYTIQVFGSILYCLSTCQPDRLANACKSVYWLI